MDFIKLSLFDNYYKCFVNGWFEFNYDLVSFNYTSPIKLSEKNYTIGVVPYLCTINGNIVVLLFSTNKSNIHIL